MIQQGVENKRLSKSLPAEGSNPAETGRLKLLWISLLPPFRDDWAAAHLTKTLALRLSCGQIPPADHGTQVCRIADSI
jgi:hypothetical protein